MKPVRVLTHSYQKPGRAKRWAFTLLGANSGRVLWISPYRYHSEQAAQKAGEREAGYEQEDQ